MPSFARRSAIDGPAYTGLPIGFFAVALKLVTQLPISSMPFRTRQLTDETSLYEYAIGALARRMRSVAELKRLMRNRVPKDELGALLVECVIARLKEQKYLNDSSYAAAYASFRRDNEKFGPRRVTTDLKIKGVHADVIEKTIKEAYSGVDEQELARGFLRRKRLKKPGSNREAARIFRALMRAGFTSRTSITILKNWDVDDELIAALEEEAGG
jgi:regulatory protein